MIEIELPIYYTQKFKTKKNKKFLVGMNWWGTSHYRIESTVKHHYYDLIADRLKYYKYPISGQYTVEYTLYYANVRCDMMNVVAVIDKYLQDGMQKINLINDDNVKYYIGCKVNPPIKDTANPRIHAIIKRL